MCLVNSFPWKEWHPYLWMHGCRSLLVNYHCNAEASAGRCLLCTIFLGKNITLTFERRVAGALADFSDSVHRLWRGTTWAGFECGPTWSFDVSGPLGSHIMNSGNGFYCAYI
jgi:hypothetical protein